MALLFYQDDYGQMHQLRLVDKQGYGYGSPRPTNVRLKVIRRDCGKEGCSTCPHGPYASVVFDRAAKGWRSKPERHEAHLGVLWEEPAAAPARRRR